MPEEQASSAMAEQSGIPMSDPAAPVASVVDYSKILDEIPEDVLLKHQRVSGHIGTVAERIAQRNNQLVAQQAAEKAAKDAEERMIREAEENPIAFTNKWLKGKAEERAQLEFSQLRNNVQREMFERIGQAYGALPEWKQLSQQEFAEITTAVAGKSDSEIVAAFNAKALDLVSNKRSAAQVKRELASQREAWEREFRAQQLANGDNPSVMGGRNFRINPASMSDAEFDKWYQQEILRG